MSVAPASPPLVPSSIALAEAQRRATQAALRESERRSWGIVIATILMGLMHRFLPDQTPASTATLTACVASAVVFSAVRVAIAWHVRNLDPHGLRRRLWLFVPLVLQVLVWSALMSLAAVQRDDLGQATFVVATFALSATAVMVGESALPWLALLWIALLMVPLGTALVFFGAPGMRSLGAGALFYGVMVSTFLPRVARERRASLLSLLLLEERARALEEARDAAVKTAAAKDAFHANLSHEIRTPLNGLTGVVDRLKRTPLSADQQEALEQLDRCGQSLLLILNDALDAVSMEAGQLTLRAEPFQLDALLTDAVGLFHAQATSKGLTLQLQRRALNHHVVGDAQRIRQVLQNLIGNAVKFTERGAIVVSADVVVADAARVELVVAVTDTGPGFDEADAARLFTRFGQLEPGRRRGGTGLGLAIARELTTLMGGTLQAASPGRGRGATFTLRVPLPLAEPARHSVRGRRVLVVDDNPLNVAVARAYLEVLGCVVDRASGGAEAVQLGSSKSYDAILMDCLMPGIGGNEAAAQLRALHVTTPIVACTASDDADTERSARAAGMQGIVHKPVSSETLLQALLRVLDPAPPVDAVVDGALVAAPAGPAAAPAAAPPSSAA